MKVMVQGRRENVNNFFRIDKLILNNPNRRSKYSKYQSSDRAVDIHLTSVISTLQLLTQRRKLMAARRVEGTWQQGCP
jgi:hypothetical protein